MERLAEFEPRHANKSLSQRGVPHRCAKPLPLQLDFVDDGHGPLLNEARGSIKKFTSAETDCYSAIPKKFYAKRTERCTTAFELDRKRSTLQVACITYTT